MNLIITRDEILSLMEQEEDFLLIDVRERFEIEQYGKIPRSVNVPQGEVEEYLEANKPSQLIVFYCRSGGRSDRVTRLALQRGYRAQNYKGSVLEWSKYDDSVQAY